MTARTALEQSLNIPTVRLALQVGMHRVVDLAQRPGLLRRLRAGAVAGPRRLRGHALEMAQVYATFAAEGARPTSTAWPPSSIPKASRSWATTCPCRGG